MKSKTKETSPANPNCAHVQLDDGDKAVVPINSLELIDNDF